MQRVFLFLAGVVVVASLAGVFLAQGASAGTDLNDACGRSSSLVCDARGEDIGDGFAQNLTDLLLFILGIGAVIMIVIGGIKYATANGEAAKISSAKNTILYSVVGLIVALLAWGIVRFVIEQFS